MGIIAHSARAEISFSVPPSAPAQGYYLLYRNDGAGGAVDYNSPLAQRPIRPWGRGGGAFSGRGIGPRGSGGRGHGYAGFGRGNGPRGYGPRARGAKKITATTPKLADGTYIFAAVAYDPAGNADEPGSRIEATATLAGTPEAPGEISATNYDPATDVLTLSWTLSADDEG